MELSEEYKKELGPFAEYVQKFANDSDPVVLKKTREKVNKVFSFWEKEMPKEFMVILDNYFYRESAIEAFSEFMNSNKDFRHYPWREKFDEKLKQMFGLKITFFE